MSDMSKYKNHPSTLLRAAYILTNLSWEQAENFEFLQKLATECENAFKQSEQADLPLSVPHGQSCACDKCLSKVDSTFKPASRSFPLS
jgi:hypothetical protein